MIIKDYKGAEHDCIDVRLEVDAPNFDSSDINVEASFILLGVVSSYDGCDNVYLRSYLSYYEAFDALVDLKRAFRQHYKPLPECLGVV